ncbi:MAG TPA: AMP-binding protein, partial [Anaeromyxobacteraceae bacterium]|nr:AMP-binding protein [Anaeromyxobacteraceae bacterium]
RDLAALAGLDLLVNCAGLVDFNPSLELAIQVNTRGAGNAVALCRRLGAALLHVSTCFVAGNRDGVVFEDEPLRGYFPRRQGVVGRPKQPALDPSAFDPDEELADCERRIAALRAEAEDRVVASGFRERAAERLRQEGRDRADEKAMRLAVGREKRLWISQRLVDLGMDRARHWGWPNTYTFTKSLGEQLVAKSGVRHAIVRPAIVESALRYPFPGWNEGFTTSAPLAFLSLKGHRLYPMHEKAILDVVPVDLVAGGVVAVSAELLDRSRRGEAPPAGSAGPGGEPAAGAPAVFHLASGDVNPFWVRRCVELVGLYQRRLFKDRQEGSRLWNTLLSRLEPQSVSRLHFEALSSPALKALASQASRLLRERAPSWGAPRLSALAGRLADGLDEVESRLAKSQAIFELYLPFIWDNKYVFRCANMRELRARLDDADRERIAWDPEGIDWRHYWLDVHLKGLEEWVFPGLEEESRKKVHPIRPHRDLVELLEAAAENHGRRTALRMGGQRKERFSYAEVRRLAGRVASFLAAAGVGRGDRVVLMAENRPEWPIAWFGIVLCGGVAVPVDLQLSAAEVANLAKSAGARALLISEAVQERLPELPAALAEAGLSARLAFLAEALEGGPAAPPRQVGPDDVASLIFTSGTTGTPKGVMLTHRNFASLVSRLAGVFQLGPGDGLLSVLPLHHTFEFTCGLLVPLSRGAEVEYLDELTADTLGDALEEGRVTAMIGVPALWSLLHRRITQELSARPGVVEAAFGQLRQLNAALRRRYALNLGKLLFWPVHRKLGGRLRILVSGGSALSPEVQQAFHEMGFDLYEGYGLTEAAPVLSVSAPDDRGPRLGNVGKPLPGIEIRILDPDPRGVGEVLARGPNVMLGYFGGGQGAPQVDRDLTGAVLRDGWLHTGDLGKLDGEGRLTIVGRKKDVIIDATGKNVYPDEVEALYQAPGLVKELSAVGLPEEGGEKVALLVVPDCQGRDRAEARRLVEEHLRRVSASLPFYKRARVWHLVDHDLPKTSTRKVKRPLVLQELQRLEAAAHRGRQARQGAAQGGEAWVLDLVAQVAGRPRAEVTHQTHLATDLGFDSLMATELVAALEEAGVPALLAEQVTEVQTAGEMARLVAQSVHREAPEARPGPPETERPATLELPGPVAALGRTLLGVAQRALYRDAYRTRVEGLVHVPRDRNFLVVANHQSHLDMGLVKVALGDAGERLATLAAADYFFDTALKRAWFENLTNLIPMDREGSIRKSLRAAGEALRRGHSLLIFPEGTRSLDGSMAPFKPTAGYLALNCGVDTLPVYLRGTHEALPKGALVPRLGDLAVLIGQPIPVEDLRRATAGLPRGEAHKEATRIMEEAVKSLRDRALRASAATRGAEAARPSESPGPPSAPGSAPAGSTEGEGAEALPPAALGHKDRT